MLQQADVVKRPFTSCGRSGAGEFNKHDCMRECPIAGDQPNKPGIGATEMVTLFIASSRITAEVVVRRCGVGHTYFPLGQELKSEVVYGGVEAGN